MKPIDRTRPALREKNSEYVAAEVVENLMAQNAAKDERLRILELQNSAMRKGALLDNERMRVLEAKIQKLSADLKASEERTW